MVKQLVIAAGGKGNRLGLGSKPLLKYINHPLIHYVILFALESDFKEFYISVNKDNKKDIQNIAKNLGIDYVLHNKAPGFRGTPLLFEEYLDDKFAFISGHHVIPIRQYQRMQEASKENNIIFTVYNQPNYVILKRDIVLFEDNILIPTKIRNIPKNFTYIDHPYVLTKELMIDLKKNNFEKSINQLIYYLKNKEKIKPLKAVMPPEFDYETDWKIFQKYLYSYLVPY
jgi:choline kinase